MFESVLAENMLMLLPGNMPFKSIDTIVNENEYNGYTRNVLEATIQTGKFEGEIGLDLENPCFFNQHARTGENHKIYVCQRETD